jgi:hypothetical protein
VGDRVELDGVDVLGVEVERGQHLVAAGGADDHHAVRRVAQHGEREGPGVVVVEAGQALGVAVVAVDGRAQQAVVEQDADVRVHLDGVDPEDRGPRREERVAGAEVVLHPVLADVGQQARRDRGGAQEQHEQPAQRRSGPAVADRQADAEAGEDHPGEDDRRRRADGGEQEDHDGAGDAGAQEVGEVQAADVLGTAGEQGRDHQPDGHEG